MNTNNNVDVNGTVVEQNDRGWKTVFVDNRLVNNVAKPNSSIVEISITCKTRFSQFAETIPDSLYAPIVYQLQQQVKVNKTLSATTEQQNLLKESKFLLARVSCLFDETKKEVLKDGKPIMSGALEVALTGSTSDVATKKKNSEDCLFEGTTKIKFNDSSYNHNKKSFVWQISYFLPQDLLNPVMTLQSPEFKVYARKKQEKQKEGKTAEKPEKTNKKRKTMEETVIVEDTPEPKKLDNNANVLTMNTENQHIWSKHFDPRGQADGLRSVLQVKATTNNGLATVQQNSMNAMFEKSYLNSQTEQQPSKIRRLMATTTNPLTSSTKQNEILIPSTKQQLIKVEDPSVEIIDLDNDMTNEDDTFSKDIQEFSSKLQELISVNRKLDQNKRCKLLELAVTEILKESASVDPSFSCKLVFSNLQKMFFANMAGAQMAFNPM